MKQFRYRLIVYVLMIPIAVLSVLQAVEGILPEAVGYVVYTAAGVCFFLACCCAWEDWKHLRRKLKAFLQLLENRFRLIRRLVRDKRYRTFFIAGLSLLINLAFALFNGVVGIRSCSPWYITLAVYYAALGVMRFWAVSYERTNFGRRRRKEIRLYRNTSAMIILLTLVLGGMVILTVNRLGGRQYPGNMIYVMALYTFIKVPMAVKNWFAARRERTPAMVTVRSISFADACVSVLSLQTAMFYSFSDGAAEYEALMNEITGGVVCALVLGMGIYGVWSARRMERRRKHREKSGTQPGSFWSFRNGKEKS